MNAAPRIAATVALFLAAPAAATPDQELGRAWSIYHSRTNDGVPRAHAAAAAYLRSYGPRFSAAFLAAATQCLMRPHNPANRAAFQQLRHDYNVGGSEALTVANWMTSSCADPAQASLGGQALTVTPSTAAAEPSTHEPTPRNPPPTVVAPPVDGPVRPAACRALDAFRQRPSPNPATLAALTNACTRESPPAAPPFIAAVSPPDLCVSGYVWREAFPGDHVCVVPATRTAAAEDNAAAASRVDPAGAYGPATCLAGYVWRDARPGDSVCVTPDRRSQAKADNAQAAQRRAR